MDEKQFFFKLGKMFEKKIYFRKTCYSMMLPDEIVLIEEKKVDVKLLT